MKKMVILFYEQKLRQRTDFTQMLSVFEHVIELINVEL
jgi:hypothetical protein